MDILNRSDFFPGIAGYIEIGELISLLIWLILFLNSWTIKIKKKTTLKQ